MGEQLLAGPGFALEQNAQVRVAHPPDQIEDPEHPRVLGDHVGERDRTALRRKYVDQFAEVLPGRKVARFYQIENKVDAVIRYDLAATIPVVETGSPPAAK